MFCCSCVVCIYAFSLEELKLFRSFGRKSLIESYEDIEILSEFLVMLTWTEEKILRDKKMKELIKRSILVDIMTSFKKYDF